MWQDDDGDGIPGVTVDLNDPADDDICGTAHDEFRATRVTDGNASYLFTYLFERVYCVDPDETTVPAGYELATANDPETVDLGPGQDLLDADFGYQPPPASVRGRVWYDNDGDGVQDGGEPGIAGVTVNLTDCADVFVPTDVTGAAGLYLFDGLVPATYSSGVQRKSNLLQLKPTCIPTEPGGCSSRSAVGLISQEDHWRAAWLKPTTWILRSADPAKMV